MLQVHMGLGMIFMLRFADVCGFCPAGFDDQGGEEDDAYWLSPDSLQNVNTCDWYWGNDDGDPGYWDSLTGEVGEEYWGCYAFEKSKLLEQHGPQAVSAWPEDKWNQERLAMDKICVSSALCSIEHSESGWCSQYYTEKVMLDCGPEDSYRAKYCTEICPPQEDPSHNDRPDNEDGEEIREEFEFPKAEPRQSKCPVKRAGIFVKNKAQELGKAALKVISSFMPALLMPPEPVSSAPVLTSAVLPTSVSIR